MGEYVLCGKMAMLYPFRIVNSETDRLELKNICYRCKGKEIYLKKKE